MPDRDGALRRVGSAHTPLGVRRRLVDVVMISRNHCFWCVVPPFGHASELRVFIDPDLLQHDEVWAVAGAWHDVFSLSPQQLGRCEQRRGRRVGAGLTRSADADQGAARCR